MQGMKQLRKAEGNEGKEGERGSEDEGLSGEEMGTHWSQWLPQPTVIKRMIGIHGTEHGGL